MRLRVARGQEASLQDEVNRLWGRFSAVIGQDVNPATVVTDLEGVRQRRYATPARVLLSHSCRRERRMA